MSAKTKLAFLQSTILRVGTQKKLAAELELSERQIRRYVAGATIPKVVVLACERLYGRFA
jgi:hypothetical protein